MPVLPESTKSIVLPRMIKVTQNFPDEKLEDVYSTTLNELRAHPSTVLKAGDSVAILVGSRGISHLSEVVKATVDYLLQMNVKPFLVPSMGSHGGGIATEQRKIIESYGVTEAIMGVPIRAGMDTVVIGETEAGIPVNIDSIASQADHIVPIVRIKVHTDFDGPIESGYCKMLAIGLGNHIGCSRLHKEGFINFPQVIPSVASVILEKRSIPFGVGIIENAHENVHSVHVTAGKDILKKEPKLLELSKSLMPKLCFEHIDVLVVEQIGKDITGAGMDPNITGRSSLGTSPYFKGPSITNIVALALSKGTHHNANGVGYADFITRELLDDIDFDSTYANGIAAASVGPCKIPVTLDTEEEAIRAAIHVCPRIDSNQAKVVRIKDTLHLTEIEVSESLVPYCRTQSNLTVHEE